MKPRRSILKMATACIVILLTFAGASAFAQGTAFTYQGRLNDGAGPANGSFDLRFALYDAASGGAAQGPARTNLNTGVSNGLFTVTLDFGNQFPGADRWLEISVRTNGAPGFFLLAPRQPLTPAPYAITAGTVTGPINGGNILNNSISGSQLASNAAAANLNASGQSGVASGGIVMSATENPALVAAGYVKLGKVEITDAWEEKRLTNAPAVRALHAAVWTGTEMIIWGGATNQNLSDGGRYNPVTETWTIASTNGAPAARCYHTAVWTGTEMLVWGGTTNRNSQPQAVIGDGARYNPTSNTWLPISTNGAPAPRYNHSAVWTGTEMIIWGGQGNGVYYTNGARYNPVANTWTPVTTTGAPIGRAGHVGLWTGTEMIIWGGGSNTVEFATGGRYNPVANTWTAMTTTDAPAGRNLPAAVWTGTEMLVWGGYDLLGPVLPPLLFLQTGGRYNPVANTWTATSTVGAPAGRIGQTGVWAGNQMIVWGGQGNNGYFNDGGRYFPAGDAWETITTNQAPFARLNHCAVWTGMEMLVNGGESTATIPPHTTSYTLGKVLNLYTRP